MYPDSRQGVSLGTINAGQQEKAAYERASCANATAPSDRPYRPSIMERVNQALETAGRANERANVAAEIGYLVEKHPEVARLIELLDRF